jgi:hypothetical protein
MRAFAIALWRLRGVRERVGPGRQTGLRPCEGLGSFSERVERGVSVRVVPAKQGAHAMVWGIHATVWVV